MTAPSGRIIAWDWCVLCDGGDEDTPEYMACNHKTVPIRENGVGYCLACGWRDDQRNGKEWLYEVARRGEECE